MKVWGRSMYAIENARHEKLETPVTISLVAYIPFILCI